MDPQRGTPPSRWPAVAALGAVLVIAGIGLGWWILGAREGRPTLLDSAWHDAVTADRLPALVSAALALDVVGAGRVSAVIVAVVAAALLLWTRRASPALFVVTSSFASLIVVQVVKQTLLRDRPDDMLVVSDVGSFPSGHTAHAATFAIALGFVLRHGAVWAAAAAWILTMAAGRTYVSAHWLSDTVGGALIGAGVAVVTAAAWGIPRVRARRSPTRERSP